MKNLDLMECRNKLDVIDKEIVRLFEERMQISRQIANYKRENALPVLDTERERALLEKNAVKVADPETREYYVPFLQEVMKLSRDCQTRCLSGRRVSY